MRSERRFPLPPAAFEDAAGEAPFSNTAGEFVHADAVPEAEADLSSSVALEAELAAAVLLRCGCDCQLSKSSSSSSSSESDALRFEPAPAGLPMPAPFAELGGCCGRFECAKTSAEAEAAIGSALVLAMLDADEIDSCSSVDCAQSSLRLGWARKLREWFWRDNTVERDTINTLEKRTIFSAY